MKKHLFPYRKSPRRYTADLFGAVCHKTGPLSSYVSLLLTGQLAVKPDDKAGAGCRDQDAADADLVGMNTDQCGEKAADHRALVRIDPAA